MHMLILNCAVIITNVVIPNIRHTEQNHLGSEPRSECDIGLCCLVYEWEYNESVRMRERECGCVGGWGYTVVNIQVPFHNMFFFFFI